MVAEFLNFYPQYRLEDLASMSPGTFYWLFGGMVDVKRPRSSESREELIGRLTREAHVAATSRRRRRR